MANKTFIGIAFAVVGHQVEGVVASSGATLFDSNGLTPASVLDFLYNLKSKRDKSVLVGYGFAYALEFLFANLPEAVRDKLFQSYDYRILHEETESEIERYEDALFHATGEEAQELRLFKEINELTLKDLADVRVDEWSVRYIAGKRLTIKRNKRSITIFDASGFFQQSLAKTLASWGLPDLYKIPVAEQNKLNVSRSYPRTQLEFATLQVAERIETLVTLLDNQLVANGIKLRSYHGATAITSAVLAKGKATDEYHSYRYRRQHNNQSWEAMVSSFYGGRIEQLQLGVANEVYVYDINSAYASASLFLPKITRKPRFVKRFSGNPFSLWFCRFNSSGLLSPFPVRKPNKSIYYPESGAGWYWFSEVNHAINAGHQVDVEFGYEFPYRPASFPEEIKKLFLLRQQLKREGNALERTLKLSLAGLYGKFSQHQGKGRYYSLYYASFITAWIRTQLLEAVQGSEESVICLLTDAIHSTVPLNVKVSEDLGAFSEKRYDKGIYIDLGVYGLYRDNQLVKKATMGLRDVDFSSLATEFLESHRYTSSQELFIGHNLHALQPLRYNRYLGVQTETRIVEPLTQTGRVFDEPQGELIRSSPRKGIVLPSGKYQPSRLRDITLAKEIIKMKR